MKRKKVIPKLDRTLIYTLSDTDDVLTPGSKVRIADTQGLFRFCYCDSKGNPVYWGPLLSGREQHRTFSDNQITHVINTTPGKKES